jgi:polyisoprenoid-binding protein YceI
MSRIFTILVFGLILVTSCKEKENVIVAKEAAKTQTKFAGQRFVTNRTIADIRWSCASPGKVHNGSIRVADGELYFDKGFTGGKFTIDMNTINVLDLEGSKKKDLEDHLKGTGKDGASDFFNVTKFPTATFDIIEVAGSSAERNTNSTVSGNLTILGVTKLISFGANISYSPEQITISTNPFTINRTDWGIKYGSKTYMQDLKDNFIDDYITIQMSILAVADKGQTQTK